MKSFLQGKRNLSIAALRPPPGLASAHAPVCTTPRATHAPRDAAGEPQVEVVKEGDKVVRLVVTCACGEKVEIECLYPVGS